MKVKDLDDLLVFEAEDTPDLVWQPSHYSWMVAKYIEGDLASVVLDAVYGSKRPRYGNRRKTMESYGLEKKLEGYRVLHAHGMARLRKKLSAVDILRRDINSIFEWVYRDRGELHPVQEWVNENDGKCLALFINVCNEMNLDVHSNSSIVLAPNNTYSLIDHGLSVEAKMFVPGTGYQQDIPKRKISFDELLSYLYKLRKFNKIYGNQVKSSL